MILIIISSNDACGQRFIMKIDIYENCNFIDTAKVQIFTDNSDKPQVIQNNNKFIIIYDNVDICNIDFFYISYRDKNYKVKIIKTLLYNNFTIQVKTDYISATDSFTKESAIFNIKNLERQHNIFFKYCLDFYFINQGLPFRMYNDF